MRYKRTMQYRVQILPRSYVIDADGFLVSISHVIKIAFAGDAIKTALGSTNTIIGPAVAKILVGELTIRGAALC